MKWLNINLLQAESATALKSYESCLVFVRLNWLLSILED